MPRKTWTKTVRLKNKMEHPDAPSGFVTLYNYKEPFMKYEEGFGFRGVLLFDGMTDRIQCHLCGDWMEYLPNHLKREHSMTAAQYKDRVGLRQSTALLGEMQRAKLISNGLERRLSNLVIQGAKSAEQREKIRQTSIRNGELMENKNERGTCPLQLITRLQNLASKLGRTPLNREITFDATLRKVFGNVKTAMLRAGLTPRASGRTVNNWRAKNPTYTRETLIQAFRDFREANDRNPSSSDARRGLVPRPENYYKHFGNWKTALDIAFGEQV